MDEQIHSGFWILEATLDFSQDLRQNQQRTKSHFGCINVADLLRHGDVDCGGDSGGTAAATAAG